MTSPRSLMPSRMAAMSNCCVEGGLHADFDVVEIDEDRDFQSCVCQGVLRVLSPSRGAPASGRTGATSRMTGGKRRVAPGWRVAGGSRPSLLPADKDSRSGRTGRQAGGWRLEAGERLVAGGGRTSSVGAEWPRFGKADAGLTRRINDAPAGQDPLQRPSTLAGFAAVRRCGRRQRGSRSVSCRRAARTARCPRRTAPPCRHRRA